MSENSNRANPKPPPVDRLSGLWRRISDHKVVQWSVAYVALAYAIQHGVILTSESLEWPNAVARVTMLLLAFGLPLVVTFAFYHGARASRNFSQAELSILAALLAIGSLFFYVLVRPAEQIAAARAPAVQQAGVAAARATATSPKGAVSIAVLPFVNLSSDKEQEFFSDGMTEEITSALAKVSNLRVVGRTSAFQFKGENKDLRAIGQALSATHLIEGSVRKDGNEVRITAQLIKADDGTHLWTESYNRELKGVFAIQEEIATAIAGALRVPLGLKAGQNLVSNRTSDTESYQDYLRARALVRAFSTPAMTEAARLLEQVVTRDPNYAPAWGLLGLPVTVLGIRPTRNRSAEDQRRFMAESLQKAQAAAQQAIRLDPNQIDGFTALALTRNFRGQFVQAEDLYEQALSIDPGNPEALHRYANMLAVVGRVKDSLAMRLRLQATEPLVPIFNTATASLLWENGRNDEAIAILKTMPAEGGQLAELYALMGRYSEAADALRAIPLGLYPPGAVEEAIRLLSTAPAKTASSQASLSNTPLGFVYLYVGAPDRFLDNHENLADAGFLGSPGSSHLWAPSYGPVRKTERFKAYVLKIGLVDYWKARGWPQFCHPTTGDDFECV